MLPPFFSAMDPADDLAWFAVADWLEEHDQPQRAELTRLTRLLRHDLHGPDRRGREDRLMELLVAGVEPCVATLTNSIGMEFVYIPAGTFLMGSPPDEVGHEADEGPVHEVEITSGFWMGKYPVTQAEYEAVMGKNPSWFSPKGGGKKKVVGMETSRFPVEFVSHQNASSFCQKAGKRDEKTAQERSYRLPTEAEWEYACRAGPVSMPFHFGTSSSETLAHFKNELARPVPVDRFLPNAFGLRDMHGNLWEWCSDWYDAEYYQKSTNKDPSGPQSGSYRVQRGCSWFHLSIYGRSACRSRLDPAIRNFTIGFRVCFTAPA